MTGQALRMRYQLHELARRHQIPGPAPIAAIPLLAPVEHDLIVEGLAATADVDRQRMKFRPWAFTFLPWQPKPPLLYRHAEPAGELEEMRYDERGRLFVRARERRRESKIPSSDGACGCVTPGQWRGYDGEY
jgi:hypothetical protein